MTYTVPPEGGRRLVQGMVFNGVVKTVCVFDADSELVHRARSMCCNDCAWEAAEDWLLANGTTAEREYVNTLRAKRANYTGKEALR